MRLKILRMLTPRRLKIRPKIWKLLPVYGITWDQWLDLISKDVWSLDPTGCFVNLWILNIELFSHQMHCDKNCVVISHQERWTFDINGILSEFQFLNFYYDINLFLQVQHFSLQVRGGFLRSSTYKLFRSFHLEKKLWRLSDEIFTVNSITFTSNLR